MSFSVILQSQIGPSLFGHLNNSRPNPKRQISIIDDSIYYLPDIVLCYETIYNKSVCQQKAHS